MTWNDAFSEERDANPESPFTCVYGTSALQECLSTMTPGQHAIIESPQMNKSGYYFTMDAGHKSDNMTMTWSERTVTKDRVKLMILYVRIAKEFVSLKRFDDAYIYINKANCIMDFSSTGSWINFAYPFVTQLTYSPYSEKELERFYQLYDKSETTSRMLKHLSKRLKE